MVIVPNDMLETSLGIFANEVGTDVAYPSGIVFLVHYKPRTSVCGCGLIVKARQDTLKGAW